MSTSILGTRVLRVEDPRFLSGQGTFVANTSDPRLDGALYLHIVASTHAHARIQSIDVSAARRCPGVLAVYTANDIDLPAFPLEVPALLPSTIVRPLLAGDTVRYVGEPIVAILTEKRAQGPDAAEAVVIDYDPLPVIVDVERALTDEIVLHPGHGSNVVLSTLAGDLAATD